MIKIWIQNPKCPEEGYLIGIEEKAEGKRVWIGDGTGEGGEFSAQKFYDVIDEFYKDNF